MTSARALLLLTLVAAAGPAAAQYYPPPPPPPPPPGAVPPPPPDGPPRRYAPPRYVPRYAPQDAAPLHTVRLQAGFAFVNDAYDCWYAGYGFGCGYGYGAAWPNLDAEVDIGVSHLVAITVGGNVFWGDWNDVRNTVWEPHLDVVFRSQPYSDIRGRLRLGLGVLAARARQLGVPNSDLTDTGAAFRVGVGASFFARSRVGLGLDAIFEAGSIGGYYVSTLQLLFGPEIHF